MKEGEKVEIRLLVKQAKKGDKEALLRLVMAEKDGDTFITIITKKDTILSRTSLNIDGKASKLQETIPVADKDLSKIEGIETKHARTLRFKGTGKNLSLDIDSIRYTKSYDALIYSDGIDN